MIYELVPNARGVVLTTPGHAGGLPILERVIHECGAAGQYRHEVQHKPRHIVSLQITLAGCGTAWTSGTAEGSGTLIPLGRCLVIKYGDPLTYAVAPGYELWDFLFVNFAGSAARDMLEELSKDNVVIPFSPQAPILTRLLQLAGSRGAHHRRLDRAASMRIACELLCSVAAAAQSEIEPEKDLVEDACAILLGSIGDNIGIEGVARTCGVSREHLTRLFQKRLGLAPAEWLRQERLRHAEVLLRSGSHTIAEVARQVGFATTSHFIHAFRLSHGLSPGRWRG